MTMASLWTGFSIQTLREREREGGGRERERERERERKSCAQIWSHMVIK